MNNKIKEEFKPRSWLSVVLIVIALIISVILINKIITNIQEKKNESGTPKTNIFNRIINEVEEETMKQRNNSTLFNSKIEHLYSGSNTRELVVECLDTILLSNKKNETHLIKVCYKKTCTTEEEKIRTIKKNFTKEIPMTDKNWYAKTTKKYDVILDYDADGYINKVTIEE